MGFNKRKMEDARRQGAEKEAAARRATEWQILEDAEQLVAAWNERQAKRMPMLFSPTIAPPSRSAIGSCERAARPAAPPATSTCQRSTDNRVTAQRALIPPGRAGEKCKANADDCSMAFGGPISGNAPMRNAARTPSSTPKIILRAFGRMITPSR
jgi:hypothetical protein